MADPKAPWGEVALAYADTSSSLDDIAARFGLTQAQLIAAARRLKWPPRTAPTSKAKAARTKVAGSQSPRATKAPAKQGTKRAAVRPKDLVVRIYNTIDKELTKLEKQKGASSQDRERASRALSQMVSSLEKAVEMQREITKDKTPTINRRDKEALKHAEELRLEIADRLERLHRKRAAGK